MSGVAKKCQAINEKDNSEISFNSRSEAANWLIENEYCTFKVNTIVKKINKAIAENSSCCGFKWINVDSPVDELPQGIHMDEFIQCVPQGVKRQKRIAVPERDWNAEVERINKEIDIQRSAVFDEAMGIKNVLYKNLPTRVTKQDLMRENIADNSSIDSNLTATINGIVYALNDIGELITLLRVNIDKKDLEEIINCGTFQSIVKIKINDNYIDELRRYLNGFE